MTTDLEPDNDVVFADDLDFGPEPEISTDAELQSWLDGLDVVGWR